MIWKRLLPRFQVCCGMELDTGKKVLLGTGAPWFRNEAVILECVLSVV